MMNTRSQNLSRAKPFVVFMLALVLLLVATPGSAARHYWTRNTNPMASMMLSMMDMMGFIERVPSWGGPFNRGWAGGRPLYPGSLHSGFAPASFGYPGYSYPGYYRPGALIAPLPPAYVQQPAVVQPRIIPQAYQPGVTVPQQGACLLPGASLNYPPQVVQPYPVLPSTHIAPLQPVPYQRRMVNTYSRLVPTTGFPHHLIRGSTLRELNGLWAGNRGELFGVRNNKIVWSDGKYRRLTGLVQLDKDIMRLSLREFQRELPLRYRIEGDRLIASDNTGHVYQFRRVSPFHYQRMMYRRARYNPYGYGSSRYL